MNRIEKSLFSFLLVIFVKLAYIHRYYAIHPAKASWIGIQNSTKVLDQGNYVFVPQARAYVS